MFFSANDGTHGYELWQTDGTSAGTTFVQDINPGSASSYPSFGDAIGNTLYLSARDSTNTTLLWDVITAEILTASAGGPYSATEGSSLTLNASGSSDADGDPLTYSWTINGHAGAATGVNPTLTWTQLQALGVDDSMGTFGAQVTIDDGHGNTATSAAATLTIVDPSVAATGGFTINATEAVSSASQTVATFTDPGGAEALADYSATINWGDSTTSAGTISYNSGTGVFTVSGAHTYAEGGSDTVTVTINHDTASAVTVTDTATVADAPLTAGALTPPAAVLNVPFSNVTVFHFSDADPAAAVGDYTAVVTLGDGKTVTLTSTASANGQIVAQGGGFDVQLSYTYTEGLSNQTFAVQVTDLGGASTSASITNFTVVGTFGAQVQVSGLTPFPNTSDTTGQSGNYYLNTEVEPSVAADPTNPRHLVGAWQQDRWSNGGSRGIGASVTTDGGNTWTRAPIPFATVNSGGSAAALRASDPWVSIGADGIVYASYLVIPDPNLASPLGLYVSASTDGGYTWSNPVAVITNSDPNFFDDKEAITADPTTPGEAYVVWDRLDIAGNRGPTLMSRTTNGGQTWSTPQNILDPVNGQTLGNQLLVLPGGVLVDVTMAIDYGTNANSIVAVRSLDHGATWSAPVTITNEIFAYTGDFGSLNYVRSGEGLPDAAVDRSNGNLYVVWQDGGALHTDSAGRTTTQVNDVFVSMSTDGGLSWTARTKVNQTPTTIYVWDQQAFTPMVAVGNNGIVAVTYYDFRDTGNLPGATTPTDAWVAFANPSGTSLAFGNEQRLTNASFNIQLAPNAFGEFLGDYQGLAAGGLSMDTFGAFFGQTVSAQDPTDIFFRGIVPPNTVTITQFSPRVEGQAGNSLVFTDSSPHPNINSYSATVDWGDGVTSTLTAGNGGIVSSGGGAFRLVDPHAYAEEGNETVTVTINLDTGQVTTGSSTITVADPAAAATGGFTINATEAVSSASQTVATFTDPGGAEALADYSATINWGDSTTSAGTISYNSGTGVFTVSGAHTYAEGGSDTVTVTINHDTASAVTVTDTATVADAPLTAGALTPPAAVLNQAFINVTVFHFSDADPAAAVGDYTAVVTLGDGKTVTLTSTASTNGQIVAQGGGFDVQLSYTYTEGLSNQTFAVQVTDLGGASTSASITNFTVVGTFGAQVQVSGLTPFPNTSDTTGQSGNYYLNTEVEPSVAADPTNPRHLVGAWQQDRWSNGGSRGIGASVTTDGGNTWTRAPIPLATVNSGGAAAVLRASDPWVSIGADGIVYASYLEMADPNVANPLGLYVSTSTDGGFHWSNPVAVITNSDPNFYDDKEAITADPTTPGEAYVVWDRLDFAGNRGPTLLSRTTNGGQTWSTPQNILDPVNGQTIGNQLVVLPGGALVDVTNEIDSANAITIAVVRSLDHGATWSAPITIGHELYPITIDYANYLIVRDGEGLPDVAVDRTNGNLYVVWQDEHIRTAVSGYVDTVFLSMSTDGGLNWSAPTIVNQTPISPSIYRGDEQAFTPMVAVGNNGIVAVTYYDFRGNGTAPGATTPTDAWVVFGNPSVSPLTFGNEQRLTNASFNMQLAPYAYGEFLGDYQGLAAGGLSMNTFGAFFGQTVSAQDPTDIFFRGIVPPNTVTITQLTPPSVEGQTGGTIKFTDSSPHPDIHSYSVTVNWGDGVTHTLTAANGGIVSSGGGVFQLVDPHTYAEEGSDTVTVAITLDTGQVTNGSSAITVTDPAVAATGGFTLNASGGVDTGSQTVATFTDPGGAEALADYSAIVDWGDATTSAATISYNSTSGVFTVGDHHTYNALGSDTITVTIHHDSASPDAVVTDTATVTTPTTTTLTAAPTSSVYGQPVNFTATVTPAFGGTPTGTVVFSEGGITLDTETLIGSTATFHAAALPVGSHTITATYSGNSTDLGSSGTAVETVTKDGTTLTLAESTGSSVFGQIVTFTATLKPNSPSTLIPSEGTVTFFQGATNLGTFNVSSGGAALVISTLGVGNHTITAKYSGDANLGASTAAGVVLTVSQASTSTAVSVALTPLAYGQAAAFTATVSAVSPSIAVPTGTVTFFDGATNLGTVALVNGSAVLTRSTLTAGSHNITARYNGIATFATSTSAGASENVSQQGTATVLAASSNGTVYGSAVIFVAVVTSTITPTTAVPNGSVTFSVDGAAIGSAGLIGGQASLSISSMSAAGHTITAHYNGNANFAASDATPLSQTVFQAGTATQLTESTPASSFSQAVTFTATVTASSPAIPTGSVNFYDGVTLLGNRALAGGSAALSITTLAVGGHTITAVYSPTANFTATSSPGITLTVGPGSPPSTIVPTSPTPTITVLSISNASAVYGQVVTLTATVAAAGFAPPPGTVTFQSNGVNVGTRALAGGTAAISITNLAVGSDSLTVVYNGSGNYLTSTSPAAAETVAQAATSTALFSPSVSLVFGQPITFMAIVTPNSPSSGIPTGTVTFFDGATSLGARALNGGVATLSTAALTVSAMHSITAVYSGSGNFSGGTSSGVPEGVAQAGTTTFIRPSITSAVSGQPIAIQVMVLPNSPSTGAPTGTVTFYDGGTVLGTSNLANGAAVFLATTLGPGNHAFTAVYAGSAGFAGSTSVTAGVTVNQAFANVALFGFPTNTPAGQVVTLTATVMPATPGSGVPTGTVSFYDGGTLLATVTLSSGSAALTISTLSVGTHTITASYSGDALFTSSLSNPFTETIT